MVDFIFKRSILKIREMAFGTFSDISGNGSDVVYMHSNDEKDFSDKADIADYQFTLVNDLTEDKESIYSRINKNCRYEIRRAEREGVTLDLLDDPNDINKECLVNEFELIYNKMFETKGLSGRFNRSLVENGLKAGQVLISKSVSCENSTCSVLHAYLIDGSHAVLMYSASSLWNSADKDRANVIGRINKHLHWTDMVLFKERGYTAYEWGGINSAEKPNGIDRFKMEFGGEVKGFYNYIVGNTLLGKVYCCLVKLKKGKR